MKLKVRGFTICPYLIQGKIECLGMSWMDVVIRAGLCISIKVSNTEYLSFSRGQNNALQFVMFNAVPMAL